MWLRRPSSRPQPKVASFNRHEHVLYFAFASAGASRSRELGVAHLMLATRHRKSTDLAWRASRGRTPKSYCQVAESRRILRHRQVDGVGATPHIGNRI